MVSAEKYEFLHDSSPTKNTKMKILVVEDDYINQAYMNQILADLDVDVKTAINGHDAIKEAKSNRYDVILMDIRLPDINGFEVTKEIRKFNPTIPIIAQTAYAMTSDEDEAYRSGCSDYISKPIKKDLLLSKLNYIKLKNFVG
jgi:CheY-like chemotaxis protein